jgi:transaldolase
MVALTKGNLPGKIKLFADGIDPSLMDSAITEYDVTGFTTNPSLMKALGVKDYEAFARDMLARSRGYPVSFEVISDDLDEMEIQARKIASWGPNAYVKIPITNTRGISTSGLIKRLNSSGVKVNVTAVFTKEQVDGLEGCLGHEPAIVSVFAGRIADAGQDPCEYIRYAVDKLKGYKNVEVLWASTREAYNVVQAIDSGAQIITVTGSILKKLKEFGKGLGDFSRETVQMFYDDAQASGFKL